MINENPNLIRLVEPEITGGKISKSTIDTLQSTEKTELEISGLRQDTLEYLIFNYGSQFKKIEFFKCPKVENLSCLEDLSQIEQIDWFWNQKATKLWDLSKNKCLKTLYLTNFKKIESIHGLSQSNCLTYLELNIGVWGKWSIDSLDTLANIDTLETLYFDTRPNDGRIAPIADIKNLKELGFANKLFKTEQIAWLKARLHDDIISDSLNAYTKHEGSGLSDNIMITGKRKPFLNEIQDAEKIKKYVAKFDALVKKYKENPDIPEPI